jgi:hypothetical protein
MGNREMKVKVKMPVLPERFGGYTVTGTRFDDMFLKLFDKEPYGINSEINLIAGDERTNVEVVSVDRGDRSMSVSLKVGYPEVFSQGDVLARLADAVAPYKCGIEKIA